MDMQIHWTSGVSGGDVLQCSCKIVTVEYLSLLKGNNTSNASESLQTLRWTTMVPIFRMTLLVGHVVPEHILKLMS